MRFAFLQLNMTVGDLDGNIRKLVQAAKTAKDLSADFCLSTELALLGYPPRDLLLNHSFIKRSQGRMLELAKEIEGLPPLLVGAAEPNSSGPGRPLFNGAALLMDGRIKRVFRKTLLPTYDVFDEDRYFEPGAGVEHFVYGGKRIAVTICEDVWNDTGFWEQPRYSVDPLESLYDIRPDVIVNLSASPFTLGKQSVRESMLTATARKYRAWLLYANQVGGNDDLVFDGRSTAFSPDGAMVARGKAFEEDIFIVDVDAGEGDMREAVTKPEDEAWGALVLGTGDYIRKCGFSGAVLGLSGGLDSSLTAAVAAEAMGPDNVLGVLLPSPYTSKESFDDAEGLIANLGLRSMTLPFTGCMEASDAALSEAFAGHEPDITEENIQSRIRGNLLMALSNKYRLILLTTGNKSEMAVGYCTIYGDMCGGLAVISDLPKSFAYDVCRRVNELKGSVIPENVLVKPPTAELRPNQKDTDSLPPYDELDEMLSRMIIHKHGREELIADGHDPAVVDRVVRLVTVAEFKRRQAAPGLKITDVSFGSGWRMPIAAKQAW